MATIATRHARMKLKRRVEQQTETSHTVSWVEDGYREGQVRVIVDIDRLVQLYGPDALGNKGKKARGMNGCVEVVALVDTIKDHRLSAKEG